MQQTLAKAAVNFNTLNNSSSNTLVDIKILTPNNPIRLKTRLIGVDPDVSVILAMPLEDEWYIARKYIREGQGAVIRLISINDSGANIIAFRTTIKKMVNLAGNWLVMVYPKELQKVSLRQFSRIPVNIECSIIDPITQNELSYGFLNDISINGCAFIGQPLAGCKLGSEYILQVKLGVKKITEIISVSVKNSLEREQYTRKKQYGLAFLIDEQETKNFVHRVIHEHLSRPTYQEEME